MPHNDNKENDVVISMDSDGTFPQTPAHLLKRTRSNVLKPPPIIEKQNYNNIANEAYDRNVSPVRKYYAQQARLPLASKDNNRPKGAALLQQQQPQQLNPSLSFRDEKFLPKKQKQPLIDQRKKIEHGHVLANPRKLQKYGSVLGCTTLPRVKSLVLKDVDGNVDGKEEDDDNNVLAAKLKEAINRPNENKEDSLGNEENRGLFHNSGLEKLIRDASQKVQRERDDDIEQGPIKHEFLPYIPNGYTPPSEMDINKLKGLHSNFALPEEDEETDEDGELLQLEDLSGGEELSSDEEFTYREMNHDSRRDHKGTTLVEIEPSYKGTGLSSSELNDLLSD